MLLVYFALPELLAHFFLAPQLAANAAEDHEFMARMQADRKELEGTYLMTSSGVRADAGTFLNPRVTWDGTDARPPIDDTLRIPPPLLGALDSWTEGAWIGKATKVSLAGLDFGWMVPLDPVAIHLDSSIAGDDLGSRDERGKYEAEVPSKPVPEIALRVPGDPVVEVVGDVPGRRRASERVTRF